VNDSQRPVKVLILEKEYRVSCSPEEQEELISAARLLDSKMREIRQAGRVIGTERIAVMAGLNIAHELLRAKETKSDAVQVISKRLQNLQAKIEIAINSSNQLEL
jgi:cell division protein ZapA